MRTGIYFEYIRIHLLGLEEYDSLIMRYWNIAGLLGEIQKYHVSACRESKHDEA